MATICKTSALLACIALLTGCDTTYEGPLQEESAEVIQLAYLPSAHGTGTGVGFGGNSVVVTSDDFTTSEVWAVVLRCERHGRTFALRDKNVYDRVKVGQKVTLQYVDVYRKGSHPAFGAQQPDAIVDYRTKLVILP